MRPEKKYKVILKRIVNDMYLKVDDFCKNPGKDFIRNRKFSFSNLIHFILQMKGGSLTTELIEYSNNADDLISKAAFVKQRSKLNDEAFPHLFKEFNEKCKTGLFDSKKLYKGKYHLYAADSTSIPIYPIPGSDAYYIKPQDTKGTSLLYINTIYDISNKTYVNATVVPSSKIHERREAAKMFKEMRFPKNSLLIADRGYTGINFFEHVKRTPNLDYLIRTKENINNEIAELPMEEWDVEYTTEIITTQKKADLIKFQAGTARHMDGYKRNGEAPSKGVEWDFENHVDVKVRFVRIKAEEADKDGNVKTKFMTFATSLSAEELSLNEIRALYKKRWGIETSYRTLKYTVGMANLHCKKEEFAIQEIFKSLIMFNYYSLVSQAYVINQKDCWKYIYKLNFKATVKTVWDYFSYRGRVKYGGFGDEEAYDGEGVPDVAGYIGKNLVKYEEGRKGGPVVKSKKSFVFFDYRVAA